MQIGNFFKRDQYIDSNYKFVTGRVPDVHAYMETCQTLLSIYNAFICDIVLVMHMQRI